MNENADLARQQTQVLKNLKFCKSITTSGPYKTVQDVPLKSTGLSVGQLFLKGIAADCKRRNDEAMAAFNYHMEMAKQAKRTKIHMEKMQAIIQSEMDSLKK
jgi:hypothetical protein